jgi:hypothetical protein
MVKHNHQKSSMISEDTSTYSNMIQKYFFLFSPLSQGIVRVSFRLQRTIKKCAGKVKAHLNQDADSIEGRANCTLSNG